MHEFNGRGLEILQLLGSGGFGEVYLGQLHGSDGFVRKVAVKVVRAGLAHRTDVSGRHRDEARLLGRLGHEHIVQCIDLANIEGVPAMILEYVEGVNAAVLLEATKGLLEATKGLPVRAAADVIEAVADALAFAHDEATREDGQLLRVIHRDVKPSNVLISLRGAIKVSDFGIARADVDREGQTGAMQLGTSAFMAPESWLRLEQGHAADVFALGVTFLQLLGVTTSERWPLDPIQFEHAIKDAVASAPALAEAPALSALVRTMLEWDPSQRPSAVEVRRQLANLPGHLPGESIAQVARQHVAKCLQDQLNVPPMLGTLSGQVRRSDASPLRNATETSGQQTFSFGALEHSSDVASQKPKSDGQHSPPTASTAPLSNIARAMPSRTRISLLLGLVAAGALAGGIYAWRPARVWVGGIGIPVCGDGAVKSAESCDDGNAVETDGCRNDCSPNAVWLSGVGRGGDSWTMGSDDCDGDVTRAPSGEQSSHCITEKPAVAVKLNPYWMQRNEFTVESALQWAGSAGITLSADLRSGGDGNVTFPMTKVTFEDARALCRAIGGDLPTEAQWEFAAHADDPRRVYPWGDAPPTCERAVTGDHNCSHGRPSAVCSRPPGNTPEGLCDMAGNVWEWTRWSFDGPLLEDIKAYVPVSADPIAIRNRSWENPEAAPDAPQQPIRGGGHWHTALFFNRARARYAMPRATSEVNIGFRCVWADAAFSESADR